MGEIFNLTIEVRDTRIVTASPQPSPKGKGARKRTKHISHLVSRTSYLAPRISKNSGAEAPLSLVSPSLWRGLGGGFSSPCPLVSPSLWRGLGGGFSSPCPLVSPLYLERLRVGELARVIDEVASLVEECRVGGRLFLYLPFSKPLPLEGLGEAVTRTSTTPPYSSTLQGSLAATACGLCSPGTSVARRSPSGVAVAGR